MFVCFADLRLEDYDGNNCWKRCVLSQEWKRERMMEDNILMTVKVSTRYAQIADGDCYGQEVRDVDNTHGMIQEQETDSSGMALHITKSGGQKPLLGSTPESGVL